MKILLLLLLIFTNCKNIDCQESFPLNLLHEWKRVDVEFPNETVRREALQSGQYIPRNMAPIDLEVEYISGNDRRVFLTFPCLREGRAFTLGVIVHNDKLDSVVKPYPDYYWHEDFRDCDKIVNAFRTTIDNCNRLWVMDNGRYLARNICPPKLLIFDLLNDTFIDKYALPDEVHRNYSSIISATLDIRDEECRNTFAYLSDVVGSRLIVVDYDKRTSWRIENKYFYPFPEYGTFNINGTKFELMDALFGKALSPFNSKNPIKDRTLFFSSLSSVKMGRVSTDIIRNQTLFINNTRAEPDSFTLYKGRRSSQSGPCAIDSDGIMFFQTVSDSSINCWNHKRSFGKTNIKQVVTDKTQLPFVSGMKIVINKSGKEELWVIAVNFHKIATLSISEDEVNYRIFVGDVNKLGQSCKST